MTVFTNLSRNAARPSILGATTTERSPLAFAFRVWGVVAIASVLAIAAAPARFPSLAEIILRGLTIAVAFLAMAFVVALLLSRQPLRNVWNALLDLLPFAAGAAVVLAWIGVWNDGSGAVALPLRQVLVFLATFGIWPRSIGPDVVARFIVLATVLLYGWRVMSAMPLSRRLMHAILMWLAGAGVLLISSVGGLLVAAFRGLSIAHAEDAQRVIGALLSGSHWSNFQSDRFFIGIGNQVTITTMLWSGALTLCVGVALGVLALIRSSALSAGSVRAMIGRAFSGPAVPALLSALLVGMLSAFGPRGFTQLNVLPLLLLVITVSASFIVWTFDAAQAWLRETFFLAIALSAFFLGWPVALCVLALFAFGALASASPSLAQHPIGRAAFVGLSAFVRVMLGQAFVLHQVMLPASIITWALPWAIIAAVVVSLPRTLSGIADVRRARLIVGVGAVGFVATSLFPVGFAVAALFGLGFVALTNRPALWSRLALPGVLAFAWISSLLRLFLAS